MIEQTIEDLSAGPDTDGAAEAKASDGETLAAVETQLAVLVRSLELVRRQARNRPSQALDRAVYLMLRTLDASGPSMVIALAALLGLDPSTAARQVAAMRDKGLVNTGSDPRDGRAVLVSPTAHGLQQMRDVRQARQNSIADLIADWPPDEQAALARVLTRLNESIREKRLQPTETH
jgi:DNA-binding MarR family transcriptional regulator